MSFKCEKHGWQHLFKSCSNCFSMTSSGSTLGGSASYTHDPRQELLDLYAKVERLEAQNEIMKKMIKFLSLRVNQRTHRDIGEWFQMGKELEALEAGAKLKGEG